MRRQVVLDEATQELGGWETPGVMERVYGKARSEEVAPEMRSAINKACTFLDVQAFVVYLGHISCVYSGEAVGTDKGAATCVWLHRCCAIKDFPKPSNAVPIRANFLGILGRRVRRIELSDAQKRVFLVRGADFCAALNVYKNAHPEVCVQARDRDEAVDSHSSKRHRVA